MGLSSTGSLVGLAVGLFVLVLLGVAGAVYWAYYRKGGSSDVSSDSNGRSSGRNDRGSDSNAAIVTTNAAIKRGSRAAPLPALLGVEAAGQQQQRLGGSSEWDRWQSLQRGSSSSSSSRGGEALDEDVAVSFAPFAPPSRSYGAQPASPPAAYRSSGRRDAWGEADEELTPPAPDPARSRLYFAQAQALAQAQLQAQQARMAASLAASSSSSGSSARGGQFVVANPLRAGLQGSAARSPPPGSGGRWSAWDELSTEALPPSLALLQTQAQQQSATAVKAQRRGDASGRRR